MAKTKKKPTAGAPRQEPKKMNPFEVHINRQKFEVLGRKLKSDRGLPGVSRSKGIKKRKATLLQEYKNKSKTNRFMDRRIGERDPNMTAEDKITARFTAAKIAAFNKKTMFNLADDEVLTHRGRALTEIEKFDDPRSEDEGSEDEKGGLSAEFVKAVHFGGGLLQHTDGSTARSRKDIIDQLIIESKKRKSEQHKQREETLDMTNKLDTEWKDLMPIMAGSSAQKEPEKPALSSYDVALRELKFEARGKPSDRLKTEEEVAREEKEELQRKEEERQRRMHGLKEDVEVPKHKSADDLDDGFEISDVEDEDEDDGPSAKKSKSDFDGMQEDSDDAEVEDSNDDGDDNDDDEMDDGSGESDDAEDDDSNSNLDDLKFNSDSEEDESKEEQETALKADSEEESEESEAEVEEHLKKDVVKKKSTKNVEIKEKAVRRKKGKGEDSSDSEEDESKEEQETALKADSEEESEESEAEVEEHLKKVDVKKKSTKNVEIKGKAVRKKGKGEDSSEEESQESEPEVEEQPKKDDVTKKSTKNVEIKEKAVRKKGKREDSSEEEFQESEPEVEEQLKKLGKKKSKKNAEVEEIAVKKKGKTQDSESKDSDQDRINAIKADLLERKAVMDAARKELPYVYAIPETLDDFSAVMAGHSADRQAVIMERILKCNHPSLAAGNKEKLGALIPLIVQHIHDAALGDGEVSGWAVLERLSPFLFNLAEWFPKLAADTFVTLLKTKQEEYREERKVYPETDTLIVFKLVSQIFETSDFRHPVSTPSMIFMSQLLTCCRVKSRRDIACGLLLSTFVLEYTAVPKRFCPAAINFLVGVLRLADPAGPKGYTPFRQTQPCLLRPHDRPDKRATFPEQLTSEELETKSEVDDTFRQTALKVALGLTSAFIDFLNDLPAFRFIFKPFLPVLENILKDDLLMSKSKEIAESIKNKIIEYSSKPLDYLVAEKKKPKVLKLYEPNITQVFADGKSRRPMSKEKQEHEKLVHKHKRAMKEAVREIRKDRRFLAKTKFEELRKNDMERRAKVKEIFGSAASQQGELNALERKKNKKKK